MQCTHLGSEWLYGILLYLYPKEFRSRYSQQMRLTFRDACRVAYRRQGVVGLFALWLPTLLDLFKSVIEVWGRQGEMTMVKERLSAWAGPLTCMVGVMWLIGSMGELVLWAKLGSADTFWDFVWFVLVALSFIPMPFALIGTLLRYQDGADLLGKIGLRLSVAGCVGIIVLVFSLMGVGMVAPDLDQKLWSDYGTAVCFLSLFGGYMLFGISALRYGILPRWNVLPVLIGVPLLLHPLSEWYNVSPYSPASFAVGFLYFVTTGMCWILIGMAMMEQRREAEPTPAL